MSKTSLTKIHQDLVQTQADLANARDIIRTQSGDYTPEGAQKAYANRIKSFYRPEQLAVARDQIAQVRAGAQKKAEMIRSGIFPTATDSTEQLAAEMTVNRMLQRPDFNRKAALAAFDTMPPSPARTLLMEECVARGVVSQEAVDGQALNAYPDYKAAQNDAAHVQSVSNSVEAKVNYLERAGEILNAPSPGATESLDVSELPGANLEF